MVSIINATEYVTDFVCTYHLVEDEDDSDTLYKFQLLQAFGLTIWDDSTVARITDILYEKFGGIERIALLANEQAERCPFCDTDELKFHFLFGYETFHLLHAHIVDLVKMPVDDALPTPR